MEEDKVTVVEDFTPVEIMETDIKEQIINNKKHQGSWIEPMREWINEAQEVTKVAESADLQLKKVLAKKIFGSNLYLENKTVRGDGQKSWSSLRSTPTGRGAVSVYDSARTYFTTNF